MTEDVEGAILRTPAPPDPRGSRLDPWVDSYAQRTRGMTASEVRALFAVASRPEVVSLAGGMPYVAALPLEMVAETVQRLIRERGEQALQYGSGQGDVGLREQITAEVLPTVGVHAHPDDVVVTVGSQQALDLVTRVFCDPGDVVLAEAPSYVGALSTFAAYQVDVVHVAMDEEGLVPEALRRRPRSRGPGRQAGEVPLHRAELSQPRRRDPRTVAASGDSPDRAARGAARARGRPVRPARVRRGRAAGAARHGRRRRRSTSGRSPRSSRPGCASARPSRRTGCARSSCSPPRRRCCARRPTAS